MRQQVKTLIRTAAWLASLPISLNLFLVLKYFLDSAISHKYARCFKKCGANLHLSLPVCVQGKGSISVGKNFRAFSGLRLEAIEKHNNQLFQPALIIGDDVSVNYNCHIGCSHAITIGDRVLIGSRVLITDHSHGDTTAKSKDIPPGLRILYSKGPVVVEDDVWLGEGVCVMPGVRIGRGAIIGANAVVTKDIPPYGIAAGTPARTIRCYHE